MVPGAILSTAALGNALKYFDIVGITTGSKAASLDNGFATSVSAVLKPIFPAKTPGFIKPYLNNKDKPFPAIGIPPPMIAPSCPYFILFVSLATARSLPVLPSSDTLSTNKVGLSASDANASAALKAKKPLPDLRAMSLPAVIVYALPNLFFKNLSIFFTFFNLPRLPTAL